jgi:hypothetical protein
MNPDILSRIDIGVLHRPQASVDNFVDNYSRPATRESSTSLTENAPQPEH